MAAQSATSTSNEFSLRKLSSTTPLFGQLHHFIVWNVKLSGYNMKRTKIDLKLHQLQLICVVGMLKDQTRDTTTSK